MVVDQHQCLFIDLVKEQQLKLNVLIVEIIVDVVQQDARETGSLLAGENRREMSSGGTKEDICPAGEQFQHVGIIRLGRMRKTVELPFAIRLLAMHVSPLMNK